MTDITKTQHGLARKAIAQETHRFDDLYHLLYKREWMEAALQHVLSNDGAVTAGVDGMSWRDFYDVEKSDFERDRFREQFIDTLQAELKARTYRPEPVRRVEIPKPGTHKTRKLGIPTIKDRVVQTLLKMVLEPIWEADFLYFSNGFRPGRCTMDCVQPLYTLCNRHMQYAWVIEGDIRACFDTIPHHRLLAEVARRVADRRVLALIHRFLKSGIMVGLELVPSEEGTPQGGIVSPLLANIYLHRFDAWFVGHYTCPPSTSKEAWRKERVKGGTKAAAQMFRYADDWIILVRGTKHQARNIKEHCKQFLQEELGLELSEEKTAITHITEGFDFLGYHIFRNTQPSDKRLVGTFVRPADKCLKRMKLKVKEMTDRRTLSDDAIRKIQAINAAVRGWAAYYRAVNPTETFKELDRYVWLRLSIWFRKKYRISPKQMQERFMHRKEGPKGGRKDYAVWDEGTGRWLWRYLAQETKLVYHRPSFKKHWPHPYLESVKVERYVLPTLKEVWTGITRAPIYEATRRVVLKRAQGACERCGQPGKLYVHHKNRAGERGRNVADNRPEMLEALCLACHVQEHRAEHIYRNKQRSAKAKAG